MMTHTEAHDPAPIAEALGITDALVLRRIGATRWAHVGGLGKGKSWAGIVELDERDDSVGVGIPSDVGTVSRHRFTDPTRLLGPYYAATGVTIRVSTDVAVVLGHSSGPAADVDDVELLRLAQLVDRDIDDITPSKRLADELEILTAVRELINSPVESGLDATLHHMLTVAAQALSCEVAVLRSDDGALAMVGDTDVSTDRWHEIMTDLSARLGDEMWCAQDLSSAPSQLLADSMPEARAMLTAIVPPYPVRGRLLFIHTRANPRGFTMQCRRLCDAMIETGTVVARTALLRDELHDAIDQAASMARTDSLTGLGNRLAWDEAVADAQEQVDNGATYSVVSLDVDGLKDINDRYGHAEGDALLQRCAEIIREHCSIDDLAVRIGGDEFAILVPHALGDEDHTYVEFSQALSPLTSSRTTVAASLGVCTVRTGESLFDGVRDADMRMYGNKQRRRRQRRRQDSRTEASPEP